MQAFFPPYYFQNVLSFFTGELLQKTTSTGIHIFLEDTSSNGTFINGEKVGKDALLN